MSGKYWFIVYAYNLNPGTDAGQRIQNTILAIDTPLDWLLQMRSKHPENDYQMISFIKISEYMYNDLNGKVG